MFLKTNGDETMTRLHHKNGVEYLSFKPFDELSWLTHAFSTRVGGVSTGCLSSMNFSFNHNDNPENVRENFRRFSEAVGFNHRDLVLSDQTHTTHVVEVGAEDRGRGITKEKGWHDVDGMVTNVPGVVLATFYADCVPLYFVDPVRRAIGLSHSGWKGSAGKIGCETVSLMTKAYGSRPEDMIAVIGPSICQTCYEVSEEVAVRFPKACSYRKDNGKYQLDLWEANRRVCLESGLKESRIFLPEICTCCHSDLLFSHRATGGKRGLLGAFLGIVSP